MPETVATDEHVVGAKSAAPVSTLELLARQAEVVSEARSEPRTPAAPYTVVGRQSGGVFSRRSTSVFDR
jgi:hypothetical protein